MDELDWLDAVLAGTSATSCCRSATISLYFRNHFKGTELEYKYTLDPAPDIWEAGMEVLRALRAGELPGFMPEYREDFQVWYYDNHLFDVLGPESERGYASFIPSYDGKNILKRKWFAEDSFARREELTHGVDVAPEGFAGHIAEELGLTVRAMPPFRRVRYDVHCESMRTGHVYGIFFDHCRLLDAPDVVLSQCEVEYLRSRNVLDHEEGEVVAEMDRVDAWVRGFLADRGWAKERSFYSKRSFLRDVVAAGRSRSPAGDGVLAGLGRGGPLDRGAADRAGRTAPHGPAAGRRDQRGGPSAGPQLPDPALAGHAVHRHLAGAARCHRLPDPRHRRRGRGVVGRLRSGPLRRADRVADGRRCRAAHRGRARPLDDRRRRAGRAGRRRARWRRTATGSTGRPRCRSPAASSTSRSAPTRSTWRPRLRPDPGRLRGPLRDAGRAGHAVAATATGHGQRSLAAHGRGRRTTGTAADRRLAA